MTGPADPIGSFSFSLFNYCDGRRKRNECAVGIVDIDFEGLRTTLDRFKLIPAYSSEDRHESRSNDMRWIKGAKSKF